MNFERKMPEAPKLRVNREAMEKESLIRLELNKKNEDGEFEGGLAYGQEKNEAGETVSYLYFTNPYQNEDQGSDADSSKTKAEASEIVKIKTEASAEEVAKIKSEIIWTKEAHQMMMAMAETYKLKQILLLEGPTAVGKTFLVDKFTELLKGHGVKPLDFYCSGQTDVSELMAKWVPKIKSEEDKKKWHEFIESAEAQEDLLLMEDEVSQENLSEEKKMISIHRKLRELVKKAGLDETVQWDFQYGSIPKAMTYERNQDGQIRFDGNNPNSGVVLHIEEVGLAEPQVINALLQLRGKQGKVTDNLQLWQNGGRNIKAGANFWVVLTTNPPEAQHGFLARNAIDPALARGVVFHRVPELSNESLKMIAKRFFTYQVGEVSSEKQSRKNQETFSQLFPLENYPDIGKKIAEVIASFHGQLDTEMRKGADKGREQKIPLTMDDFARVASYINTVQLRDPQSGYFDLLPTLKKAIRMYYLERIADDRFKKTKLDLLDSIWTAPVHDEKMEDGTSLSAADYLQKLVKDAYESELVAEFDPMVLLELQSGVGEILSLVSEIQVNFEQIANSSELQTKVSDLAKLFEEMKVEINSYLENFEIDPDELEAQRQAKLKAGFESMSDEARSNLVTGVNALQSRIQAGIEKLKSLESQTGK